MIFFSKHSFSMIILFAFFARIIAVFFFRDTQLDHEWGIILNNLENNNILSVHEVQGVPVPMIFMPPLYPLLLYVVKTFFNDLDLFLWTVQFIQIIFGIIAIIFTKKILSEFFSEKMSNIGALIFGLFPLNVYAVSQISSISLQVFLINFFIYSFIKLFKEINFKYSIIFSITSGMLMLLRGEFFVFVILSLIYLYLKKKNLSKVLIMSLISVLIISPYLYRNYNIFNVLTITKSSGYNLLKGNHPRTKVEGTGMFLKIEEVIPEVKVPLEQLKSQGPIKSYDLLQDQVLMDQALIFIKSEPLKYISLYFKKFFAFMFLDINSSYPNYYSIFHIVPKLILAAGAFLGILITFSLKINIYNYVVLFYLANISLFSIFFILPRYSLSLLTIQIILSLLFLKKIKPNW